MRCGEEALVVCDKGLQELVRDGPNVLCRCQVDSIKQPQTGVGVGRRSSDHRRRHGPHAEATKDVGGLDQPPRCAPLRGTHELNLDPHRGEHRGIRPLPEPQGEVLTVPFRPDELHRPEVSR